MPYLRTLVFAWDVGFVRSGKEMGMWPQIGGCYLLLGKLYPESSGGGAAAIYENVFVISLGIDRG